MTTATLPSGSVELDGVNHEFDRVVQIILGEPVDTRASPRKKQPDLLPYSRKNGPSFSGAVLPCLVTVRDFPAGCRRF